MNFKLKVSILIITTGALTTLRSDILDDIKKGWDEKIAKPFERDVIKPSDEFFNKTVPDIANKAATEIKNKIIDPADTFITKTLPDAFDKTQGVITGTISIISQIPELVKKIDDATNGITSSISTFEKKIKELTVDANPLTVLDSIFFLTQSLIATTQTILPTITPIKNLIDVLGDKLIKPFDTKTGTEVVSVAQKITEAHQNIKNITDKIQGLIPKFHIQTRLMHDDIKKSVDAIKERF